jgi:hypothetical protein
MNLDIIKQAFSKVGVAWTEPYLTTEGEINRKQAGMHRGLYWIYPDKNFYFGKAATNTVHNRHKTHRAKLDVDLAALYSTPVEKKEPKWIFPEGWKEAVREFIIEDQGDIPSHYAKTDRGTVVPGVLDYPVKHLVDIDTLPVLVWNLDHCTKQEISDIEELVIETLWPYANDETYRQRKKNG